METWKKESSFQNANVVLFILSLLSQNDIKYAVLKLLGSFVYKKKNFFTITSLTSPFPFIVPQLMFTKKNQHCTLIAVSMLSEPPMFTRLVVFLVLFTV